MNNMESKKDNYVQDGNVQGLSKNKRKKKRDKVKGIKKRKKKNEDKQIEVECLAESSGQFTVDMSSLAKKKDVVKIGEIQQLFLSSLLGPNKTAMPRWASLETSPVDRVAVVLLKYVTAKMFSQNEVCMPNLSKMFDVVDLVLIVIPPDEFPRNIHDSKVQRKAGAEVMYNGILGQNWTAIQVFPYKNEGHHVFVESPAHTLLTLTQKKAKTTKGTKDPLALHAKDYILTEKQLIKNDFVIPGLSTDAEDVTTIPLSSTTEASPSSPIFALDCEMCMSSKGKELTRISVIDSTDQVVYDTLVKPENSIIDYLTRYSGITKNDLSGVTTTLKDVQEKLKEIIPPDAILVGHSLEFDFASLRFFHDKVIDTSVIYGDGRGMGFKPGLKYLAKKYLKEKIQNDYNGHCSIEDARTCMHLAQLKITKGPEFGLGNVRDEISLFDHLHKESTRTGVMVDRKSNIKQYSGCADSIPCSCDEEVVENVIKVLPKYDFIWSQFHGMDSLGEGDKQANVKLLLQQMDTNLAEIHKHLPEGTLFVVFLGSADTRWLRKLRESRAGSKMVKNAANEIQRGLCFIKLV